MGDPILYTVEEEKELGFIIQDTATPEKHIQIFGETYTWFDGKYSHGTSLLKMGA